MVLSEFLLVSPPSSRSEFNNLVLSVSAYLYVEVGSMVKWVTGRLATCYFVSFARTTTISDTSAFQGQPYIDWCKQGALVLLQLISYVTICLLNDSHALIHVGCSISSHL